MFELDNQYLVWLDVHDSLDELILIHELVWWVQQVVNDVVTFI